MRLLGVDACRQGWVAVELDGAGRFVRAHLATGLAELLALGATVLAVDVPLGLLKSGWRAADDQAVTFVGPRRASVFRVPPRAVWDEPTYSAANARCMELNAGGMSRQAWALGAKLREANDLWLAAGGAAMYEVHPEVSFRAMAGEPLAYGKRTWSGQRCREDLLRREGIELPADLGGAGDAAVDDVLDAAAAAWSARRIATGRHGSLPDPPQGRIAIRY